MKQKLWMLCAWFLIGPALAQEPPVVQNKTPAMRRAEQAEAENVRLKAELEAALKHKPAPLPASKPAPKPKPVHESASSKTPAKKPSALPEPAVNPAGSKAPATPLIANRYQPLGDGAEIKDTKTGLIWQRCAVGMSWNGQTCTGEVKVFNFDDAQALAVNGWRVPDKDELIGMMVKTVKASAINREAFPATPSTWFWSSSPYAGSSDCAWYVAFSIGFADYNNRHVSTAVRLVRSGQ